MHKAVELLGCVVVAGGEIGAVVVEAEMTQRCENLVVVVGAEEDEDTVEGLRDDCVAGGAVDTHTSWA